LLIAARTAWLDMYAGFGNKEPSLADTRQIGTKTDESFTLIRCKMFALVA
jgi:hypothetical protein